MYTNTPQLGIDAKTLNKKIAALGKRTETWRNEVQEVLVNCAFQALAAENPATGKPSHNIDPCTRVVHVLSGAHLTAVVKWLEKHTPVIWRKEKEAFVFNKSFKGEYDAPYLLGQAWWKLAQKPKQVTSSIDVVESVRELIKRMEREVAAGKKEVRHQEALQDLKAVAGKYAQMDIGDE